MRQVYSALFISLDGVVESPENWQFDYFDSDMVQAMATHINDEDTVLMGRGTYEAWVNYWPISNEEPYASHINSTPKYVVSTTLDRVEWGEWDNVTLIKENLAEEIARLKQQPGARIGVAGSPTLVCTMLEEDLIDVLTLMIHPVVVGSGKRLFSEDSKLMRLKLVDSQTTSSGVAFLTYKSR